MDVSTADFLSSFTNEVVALRNSGIKIGNLNQALDKLDELKIVSDDFISWDKLESNKDKVRQFLSSDGTNST